MATKPSVIIPVSELDTQLLQTAQIKAEMTELLRQLEETLKGRSNTKPGGWRHDPTGWLKET